VADGEEKTETPGDPRPQPTPDAVGTEVTGKGGAPEPVSEGGIDKQLVGLAVILWLLAMGILIYKWPRLRVDWYLGNLKEAGDLTGRLDKASIDALAGLAKDDPSALGMIGEEVVGPLANRDEVYRSAIVKTLEQVPGDQALDLLLQAATDYHPVVRANTYLTLGLRAQRMPDERGRVLTVLLGALGTPGDPEPMARAIAASALGELKAKEAVWPLIRAVREARGTLSAADRKAADEGELKLRELGSAAFYSIAGVTSADLPFDPNAPLAARDAQVRAWERWYVGQGGTIPEGEAFDAAHPATPASPPDTPAPPAPARTPAPGTTAPQGGSQ
jgi:hypothetical protein